MADTNNTSKTNNAGTNNGSTSGSTLNLDENLHIYKKPQSSGKIFLIVLIPVLAVLYFGICNFANINVWMMNTTGMAQTLNDSIEKVNKKAGRIVQLEKSQVVDNKLLWTRVYIEQYIGDHIEFHAKVTTHNGAESEYWFTNYNKETKTGSLYTKVGDSKTLKIVDHDLALTEIFEIGSLNVSWAIENNINYDKLASLPRFATEYVEKNNFKASGSFSFIPFGVVYSFKHSFSEEFATSTITYNVTQRGDLSRIIKQYNDAKNSKIKYEFFSTDNDRITLPSDKDQYK